MGGEVEEEAAWVTNGNVDERMDAPPAAKKDRRDAVWCRTTVDDFGGEVTIWLLLLGEYNVKAVTAVLDSDRTAAVAERRRLPDFVMVKIKKNVESKRGGEVRFWRP